MTQLSPATSFIRQRGQLTIPKSIRRDADWASPGSPVTLVRSGVDEIAIRPFVPKKSFNWEELYKQMKRVRAFKGKGNVGNLSEFIAKDREARR